MGVDRVHRTITHGASGRDERLRDELTAEGAAADLCGMTATEDVLLDLLQIEQAEENVEIRRVRQCHRLSFSPSRCTG